MNVHEYQTNALLRDYGVSVVEGHLATTPDETVAAASKLKPSAWVVKAQIHAGGRGKGGGIKLVKTLEELRGQAERLLGRPLVMPHTGPKGRPVATLARHFESEVGVNLREWRRRLRLFRSIEWLGAGRSVTDVAFELGYSSTSAFTYMFRHEMGYPPTRWRAR
jgi:hypothetical protein